MSDEQDFPTGRVYPGEVVKASYGDPGVACYRGNPMIEALPQILSAKQVIKRLAYYPDYDESGRLAEPHIRLHMIDDALNLFIPLSIHVDLEQRFSRLIRGGYKGRNPFLTIFWKDREESLQSSRDFVPQEWSRASERTRGFNIIGTSGGGKTTSIKKVLSMYPKAIIHSRYGNQDFIYSQLVWLQLQCPFDGNPRDICMSFFRAVDNLLGTHYERVFGRGKPTLDQLRMDMAGVASGHCLGVLVIDDIEHLSTAKSGGAEALLNFFVQLANTIKVPVVLVSTFKALKVLTREFRQIRRGTGQGDMVWDRMLEDWTDDKSGGIGEWQRFLKQLWKYQFVRNPQELTGEISEAIYYETQGVTDFVVKVFMLAQIRAITNGSEQITPNLIHAVSRECLRLAQPVLRVLRRILLGEVQLEEIALVDDIHRIDLEPFMRRAQRELQKRTDPDPREGQEKPSEGTDAARATEVPAGSPCEVPPGEENTSAGHNSESKPPARKTRDGRGRKQSPKANYAKGDLRRVLSDAKQSGTRASKALSHEGHMGSQDEFLDGSESK